MTAFLSQPDCRVEAAQQLHTALPQITPNLQEFRMPLYLIVVETYVGIHDVIMQVDSDYTMLFDTRALAEAYAAEHLESDYRVFEW